MLIRQNYRGRGPDPVHGRSKEPPVKADTGCARESFQKLADAATVANDDKLVGIKNPTQRKRPRARRMQSSSAAGEAGTFGQSMRVTWPASIQG